jgi:ferredoxin-NADP reductase
MSSSATRIPVRVAEISPITTVVKRIRLEPVDGASLACFSGGAHVMLEWSGDSGIHRNAYSLMSSPSDKSSYMICVRAEPNGRGGSLYLHEQLAEGDLVQIGHPVNLFPLAKLATKHLFIAGGIGITPFLSMIAELVVGGGAPFELHYAARSQALAAYGQDLSDRFGGRVRRYHSDANERLALDAILLDQPLGTHLYVCGPARLIETAIGQGRALGWPDESIHQERFIAPPSGAPYTVELARSALAVSVEAQQSMLDAIEAAGVEVSYLCRGGACGQCETQVVLCDGELLHADHFLSEVERISNTKVMPCVSRFLGQRLVLDL